MKHLSLKFIVILLMMTSFCKAQEYATVRYWGKEYKLERSYFEYLNGNYNYFMSNTAPNLRYYDFKDYQNIYLEFVENFKKPSFTIIVTEANQLQWENSIGILPGTDGEHDRSKKSHNRASILLYQVVLPSLQQFVRSKGG
jgi:hypothetical protein